MLGHCELLVQIVPSHLFIISEETGSSLLQREKRNLKVYSCRICEARSRVSTKDERTEVEESVRELGKPVMRVWSFIFQSEKIIKGEEIIEREYFFRHSCRNHSWNPINPRLLPTFAEGLCQRQICKTRTLEHVMKALDQSFC